MKIEVEPLEKQEKDMGPLNCRNRTPQLGGGGYVFFFFTRRRVPGVPRVNSEGGQGAAVKIQSVNAEESKTDRLAREHPTDIGPVDALYLNLI
jgi:hypothetical protein